MFQITNKINWVPLYIFLIFIAAKDYKKESIWLIFGAILLILLTDLVVSGIMKPFFERLRPSRDPALEGLVHIVNGYRGGMYGFASGHAATSFFLATFMWLALRKVRNWIWILFIWAFVFSYSRIYLGVHYPGDILAGAAIGILTANLGYRIYTWFFQVRARRKSE